jgi:hypothetical protein
MRNDEDGQNDPDPVEEICPHSVRPSESGGNLVDGWQKANVLFYLAAKRRGDQGVAGTAELPDLPRMTLRGGSAVAQAARFLSSGDFRLGQGIALLARLDAEQRRDVGR